MDFLQCNIIKIDREISELDKFTLEFIEVLKKYSKYAIISGYVSILLGRSRSSENVNIIIPAMDFAKFQSIYSELLKNGFYCLNAEAADTVYDYLKDKIAVRFAKENTAVPNIELKFAKNHIDQITLNNTITVKMGKNELVISHLELQIAFKEQVLKSPKDLEDARHIRNVAKGHLDESLIQEYEKMLHEFY